MSGCSKSSSSAGSASLISRGNEYWTGHEEKEEEALKKEEEDTARVDAGCRAHRRLWDKRSRACVNWVSSLL